MIQMKNNIIKIYALVLYFCATYVMMADPGTTDDTGTLEETDTPLPIDDYLWILAIVGLSFVFWKLKNNIKHSINN